MSETVDIVVEIPKGSRNKYEINHETHEVWLDRRLFSATTYPADYGFVPDTLAEDGDPLDVLVLIDEPTFPGCHVRVRPLGILWMTDEAGPDAKLLCVVDGDPAYEKVQDLDDLPGSLLAEVRHFFDTYKELEPGKSASTKSYEGPAAAWQEIADSRARYVDAKAVTPG